MSYCAVSDVERLMGIKFTATSRPATDDVSAFIDHAAADLDGVAQSAGYTVPVTGTQAVALMKRYNVYGAAVAAWHAGFVSDDLPPRVEYWDTQYNNFIARLRRGEQELPGADSESDTDPFFGIAPAVPRDEYWTTEESLEYGDSEI